MKNSCNFYLVVIPVKKLPSKLKKHYFSLGFFVEKIQFFRLLSFYVSKLIFFFLQFPCHVNCFYLYTGSSRPGSFEISKIVSRFFFHIHEKMALNILPDIWQKYHKILVTRSLKINDGRMPMTFLTLNV